MRLRTQVVRPLFPALLLVTLASASAAELIGITDLSGFERGAEAESNALVLVSPAMDTVPWTELVLSWNVAAPADAAFDLEVQPIPDVSDDTRPAPGWYSLGHWSPAPGASHSVPGQADDWGEVLTDTLRLRTPVRAVRMRVRVTCATAQPDPAWLRFLGLSLLDTSQPPPPFPPPSSGAGLSLDVPLLLQVDYPEGVDSWCSPASLSMLIRFWADRLGDPALTVDVPDTAAAVNDPSWPGTGNWSFNVAHAGSFPPLRAYVTRLRDLTALESLVRQGIPVAASVSYNRLKGLDQSGSGHLVVCTGFTSAGDVRINDPGSSRRPRPVVPRSRFDAAWAESNRTVYVVHPEAAPPSVPGDPGGAIPVPPNFRPHSNP